MGNCNHQNPVGIDITGIIENMVEHERRSQWGSEGAPYDDLEGLPTDEQDVGNVADVYNQLSLEELERINRAAEDIQIALEQGSDDTTPDVPMANEPEPPLPDKQQEVDEL
jgi:hypothetical protein